MRVFLVTVAVVLASACPHTAEGEGEGGEGAGEGEPGSDLGVVVFADRVVLAAGPSCNERAGDQRHCEYGCIDALVLDIDGVRRSGTFGTDNELAVDATGWQAATDVVIEIGGCGDGVARLPLTPQASPRLTRTLALDGDRATLNVSVDDGVVVDCVAPNGDLFGFVCRAAAPSIPLPTIDDDEPAERFLEARRTLPGLDVDSPVGAATAVLRGEAIRADRRCDVVDAGAAVRARGLFSEEVITATRDGTVPTGLATPFGTVVVSGDGTDVDGVHVDADIEGVLVAGAADGNVISYDSGDLGDGDRVVVNATFFFVERP